MILCMNVFLRVIIQCVHLVMVQQMDGFILVIIILMHAKLMVHVVQDQVIRHVKALVLVRTVLITMYIPIPMITIVPWSEHLLFLM